MNEESNGATIFMSWLIIVGMMFVVGLMTYHSVHGFSGNCLLH